MGKLVNMNYLDNVAHRISSFGISSFGRVGGDFDYALFPYPAYNEQVLSDLGFGRRRRKTRKSVGYIVKNKRVLKVYDKNGKKVTYDGKSVGSRKVYKTLSSARNQIK